MTNFSLRYIIVLILLQRKVSHQCRQFSFQMIMNSTCTKGNSVTNYAWNIIGALQSTLRHVTVQQHGLPHGRVDHTTQQDMRRHSISCYRSLPQCYHQATLATTKRQEIDLIISKYTDNNACIDISTRGLWNTNVQDTSFDPRVFLPNAPSSHSPAITTAYMKHEAPKKRKYMGHSSRHVSILYSWGHS